MPIFQLKGKTARPVKTHIVETEAELQRLLEGNLDLFFGLKFVRSEFRNIDTLAFDESSMAPILIEYKKDQHESVIDQGFSYLADVLDHKGDVKLEIEEKLGKKIDVDWSQTRILFIANRFSEYQVGAMSLKGLPFELWRYELSEDGQLVLEQIKPPQKEVTVSQVLKKKTIFQEVSRQLKPYTVEDHLKRASEGIKELFQQLRKEIFELDTRIQEKPVSWYVGYKIRYYNFCTVSVYKNKLRIYARIASIDDSKKVFKKVPAKWAWGKTTIWYWDISSESEMNYATSIVRQSYEAAPDK